MRWRRRSTYRFHPPNFDKWSCKVLCRVRVSQAGDESGTLTNLTAPSANCREKGARQATIRQIVGQISNDPHKTQEYRPVH